MQLPAGLSPLPHFTYRSSELRPRCQPTSPSATSQRVCAPALVVSCHVRRPSNLPCAHRPRTPNRLPLPSLQHGQACESQSRRACVALEGRQKCRNAPRCPCSVLCCASGRRPRYPRSQHEVSAIPNPVRFPHPGIAIVAQCVLREAFLLPSLPLPRTRPVILPCTIHQHHPALPDRTASFFCIYPGADGQSMCCRRRQGTPFATRSGAQLSASTRARVSLARLQNKHASSRLPKRSPQPIQSPPKRASPSPTTTRNTSAEPHNLPARVLQLTMCFRLRSLSWSPIVVMRPQICYIPSQTRPVEQTKPKTHARPHGRAFALSRRTSFFRWLPIICLALPIAQTRHRTGLSGFALSMSG